MNMCENAREGVKGLSHWAEPSRGTMPAGMVVDASRDASLAG